MGLGSGFTGNGSAIISLAKQIANWGRARASNVAATRWIEGVWMLHWHPRLHSDACGYGVLRQDTAARDACGVGSRRKHGPGSGEASRHPQPVYRG